MFKIWNLPTGKLISRNIDGASIPMDEGNTDYQAYLQWISEGNIAEEWNPGGSE
jgi:hypothetical protein